MIMADKNDPAEGMRRATEAFRQAGERAQAGGNQISMKMIEQAERNTREVFAAMRQIASAGNMADVMRIQGEFVRDQGGRAMDQAKEIGELIAQFGRDTVDGMKTGG